MLGWILVSNFAWHGVKSWSTMKQNIAKRPKLCFWLFIATDKYICKYINGEKTEKVAFLMVQSS